MDREDNVLESIFGEGPDFEDVEMLDVEEGEFVDQNISNGSVQANTEVDKGSKQETENKNRSKRGNKKKNRRKRNGSGLNVDRFVIETCRRLKEKKSYMVYTAVGCLGLSAMSDIVKEVEAIQACGGQKTADGKRQKFGGGILWGIIKVREPNAYREIMKRAKEFEKQFRLQKATMVPQQPKMAATSHENPHPGSNVIPSEAAPFSENQTKQSHAETKRKPVMDRIRVPVSYKDIVDDDDDDAKDEANVLESFKDLPL